MTPEELQQYFDRITEAPDAVPRLRQFILNLAVRGKLVPQDPNDEPASESLKRIVAECARKERVGTRRKREPFAPVSESEYPFAIPLSWTWARLGQVGDWGSGSTPARGNHEYFGGTVTWLKSGELADNQHLSGSEELLTELAISKGSFRRNQPGDVLIAMYGATIGKVAILEEPAVTNQAVCGCTPVSGVFNRYLFTFLVSQRTHFQIASEGAAQPNISREKIIAFTFPLPPLPEQHRIVAKVDELMSLCDKLEAARKEREDRRDRLVVASLQRLNEPAGDAETFREHARFHINHLPRLTFRPEHVQRLRQAILNLAVRGKLVPQDPNDEPASELLKRIHAERSKLTHEGEVGRKDILPPPAESDSPFEVPGRWQWERLGNLLSLMKNGLNAKPSKTPARYKITRIETISFETIDLSRVGFVEVLSADLLQKHAIKSGDILFSHINSEPHLGKTAICNVEDPALVHGVNLLLLRTLEGLSPHFVNLAIRQLRAIGYFVSIAQRAVNQSSINQKKLRITLIPIPPLAEQIRIVARVDELMAVCDRLDASLQTTQTQSGRLLEAVLHEALETAA